MPRTALLLAALGAAFAGGTLVHGAAAPTRTDLGAVDNPHGARGRTLALTRVVIPAGASLPLHRHPGTGVARIVSGRLTYTVKKGRVDVHEGTSVVGAIAAGQTGIIRAGQWIVEQPSVIHRARNATSRPIVIYLATLYPIGAAPSIPVQ